MGDVVTDAAGTAKGPRLFASLYAVRIPGVADDVANAAEARHESKALAFVESAALLQPWGNISWAVRRRGMSTRASTLSGFELVNATVGVHRRPPHSPTN